MTKTRLLLHLIAMILVVVVLILGISIALNVYTNHGENVSVPNIIYKDYEEAKRIIEANSLEIEVKDTGYVKSLPKGCILDQMIDAGSMVKPGRIVYVTINAIDQPRIVFPDIVDNSSIRDATLKLKSMGFKLGKPMFVPGEKDWVYGALVNGKQVKAGEKVSVESIVILQVGDGRRDENDSVMYVEPEYYYEYEPDLEGEEIETSEEVDEFVPVEEPSTPPQPEEKKTPAVPVKVE